MHVLSIRRFINLMDLLDLSHIQGIYSFKINIVCTFVKSIDVFASLLSITLPVELVFCLFYPCSFYSTMSQYFCMLFLKINFCLVVTILLNECDQSPFRRLYFSDYLHGYNRLLKMVII